MVNIGPLARFKSVCNRIATIMMIFVSALRGDQVLVHFSCITAVEWGSLDRRKEGADASVASVGSADGRPKVVGSGGCLDNAKRKGVVPVERLTCVLHAYESDGTKIYQSYWCSAT